VLAADLVDDLVERSGTLKRELLEFAFHPRYRQALNAALSAQSAGGVVVADEDELVRTLDRFVLLHRLSNGRTVLEEFVAARNDLPEAEREMLLGWHDVVEGIFEVVRHDAGAMVVDNLVDELTYRVRSNMGMAVLRRLRPGSFVIGRLVPLGLLWLVSGALATYQKGAREALYETAAEMAQEHPRLAFRNPDRLRRAWEMQRSDRDRFVRFFGADIVVLPGSQLPDQMQDYYAFSRRETLAELAARGEVAEYPDQSTRFNWPLELVQPGSVAVIYDEAEGLGYFTGFDDFEQAFADPGVLSQPRYRQRVLDYLDDDSVSPLPFRRLAERDPDRASLVMQTVLRCSTFDWRRDGEGLMRERKSSFFQRAPLPCVLPVSRRLAPYVVRMNPGRQDGGGDLCNQVPGGLQSRPSSPPRRPPPQRSAKRRGRGR
jgi:hypothetical protein